MLFKHLNCIIKKQKNKKKIKTFALKRLTEKIKSALALKSLTKL